MRLSFGRRREAPESPSHGGSRRFESFSALQDQKSRCGGHPETVMTHTPAGPAPHAQRTYRYYDLVMAAFVTVLLCANLIGAAKVAQTIFA